MLIVGAPLTFTLQQFIIYGVSSIFLLPLFPSFPSRFFLIFLFFYFDPAPERRSGAQGRFYAFHPSTFAHAHVCSDNALDRRSRNCSYRALSISILMSDVLDLWKHIYWNPNLKTSGNRKSRGVRGLSHVSIFFPRCTVARTTDELHDYVSDDEFSVDMLCLDRLLQPAEKLFLLNGV